MPRRNEQPTLFELTAGDEPEAPRGLPPEPRRQVRPLSLPPRLQQVMFVIAPGEAKP
jgi:hypothetical protein